VPSVSQTFAYSKHMPQHSRVTKSTWLGSTGPLLPCLHACVVALVYRTQLDLPTFSAAGPLSTISSASYNACTMVRPRGARQSLASTPAHAMQKIPLNDDSAEKANRNKERSLQQSIQKERIRAAASPGVRRVTLGSDVSPKTPRNVNGQGPADTVTPLRKVPILANFEEWMKLATDNVATLYDAWWWRVGEPIR
jgi:hypothetical protein